MNIIENIYDAGKNKNIIYIFQPRKKKYFKQISKQFQKKIISCI